MTKVSQVLVNTVVQGPSYSYIWPYHLAICKWDITFRAEDIAENITRCNLRSHG